MLDNPTNQTQDDINSDQVDILGTADGVVTQNAKIVEPADFRARLADCYRVLRVLSGVFAPVEPSRSGNSD